MAELPMEKIEVCSAIFLGQDDVKAQGGAQWKVEWIEGIF